jgi:hypothetical protein
VELISVRAIVESGNVPFGYLIGFSVFLQDHRLNKTIVQKTNADPVFNIDIFIICS